MHLLAAPFIITGLVLKIYNNKKNRRTQSQKEPNDRPEQQINQITTIK